MSKKKFTIYVPYPQYRVIATNYLNSEETILGHIFDLGIINDFASYEVVEISIDKSEIWLEIHKNYS